MGGLYGAFKGLTSSPSPRFRVRMNHFLNMTARHGSRAGNALGVLGALLALPLPARRGLARLHPIASMPVHAAVFRVCRCPI